MYKNDHFTYLLAYLCLFCLSVNKLSREDIVLIGFDVSSRLFPHLFCFHYLLFSFAGVQKRVRVSS